MLSEIIDKEDTDNTIYRRLVRLWLVTILLILPFQIRIATSIAPWRSKVSNIINYLDEFTVVIFLLLSIGEYYKHRKALNKIFFFYFPL